MSDVRRDFRERKIVLVLFKKGWRGERSVLDLIKVPLFCQHVVGNEAGEIVVDNDAISFP